MFVINKSALRKKADLRKKSLQHALRAWAE